VADLTDIIKGSSTLEPQSKSVYLLCVQRFEAFARGSWTPATVERWRDALTRENLKPRTVNKHLYALRYATKRREALGRGPDFARAAEGLKDHRTKRRAALTVDDVEAMLATCTSSAPRDLRDRCLITLGVRTGLRVSELGQLSWAGIEGRKASVRIKGGHSHTTYLDDECLAALKAWAAWQPAKARPGRVFIGLRETISGEPSAGKPLSRQALHKILVTRGKEAGIRRSVHPHLLRHTFISWALEAGVPAQRVMIMTGHKSLATLSGYVTDLQAEADPVGGYLPKLGKGRR
jgi:integrase